MSVRSGCRTFIRAPSERVFDAALDLDLHRPERFVDEQLHGPFSRFRHTHLFRPEGDGTRIIQVFRTQGIIPAIAGWIFSKGSYKGSFKGELESFRKLAERDEPPPGGSS